VQVFGASDEARGAWAGLHSFVAVRRTGLRDGRPEDSTSIYITSLDWGAERLGRAIQGHWAVENSLHWVKDAILGEDGHRIGDPGLCLTMTLLKTLTVNLLRRFEPFASVKARIYEVAHDIAELVNICS
jgi:predicted transposase YbfD/YdcC